MKIHAFLEYRAGKRILVDPQQHCVGKVQAVDVLALLQKHDQPEIMGIALKMLILPFQIFVDRLLLQRTRAGFQRFFLSLFSHKLLQNIIEHFFPFVAEWRVAEIMRDSSAFHHFGIDYKTRVVRLPCFHLRVRAKQALGGFTGNLCHFQE